MANKKPTKNVLSAEKTRLVRKWLETHWQTVVAEEWSQIRAAQQISQDLGFLVGDHQVARIAKIEEFVWPTPHAERSRQGASQRTKLDEAVGVLGRSIITLYEKLGEPLPAQLKELAQHGTADGPRLHVG